jgi:hypothetical protein
MSQQSMEEKRVGRPPDGGATRRFFEAPRSYALVFAAYFFNFLLVLRVLDRSRLGLATPVRPSIVNLGMALCCAAFFLMLLKATQNGMERTILVLSALFFVHWFLDVLSADGYSWATIPHSLGIAAADCALVTALVGIRAIQVTRGSKH